MNIFKVLACLLALSLMGGCAKLGLKPHKPAMKSSLEITKTAGMFKILSVRGETSEVTKILDGDLMSCGTTTFSMPRGNTVGTFIREIYDQELLAAEKYSATGEYISVLIKSIKLDMLSKDNGVWKIDIDYTVNDNTTNVKTEIEFSSKVSMLTSCSHTASMFEDAVADSFVDFFKKIR